MCKCPGGLRPVGERREEASRIRSLTTSALVAELVNAASDRGIAVGVWKIDDAVKLEKRVEDIKAELLRRIQSIC